MVFLSLRSLFQFVWPESTSEVVHEGCFRV